MFFCIVILHFLGCLISNKTSFVSFLALTICILQLFCGLCLSWFRCLWPTWAGQILLLAGLKHLQCAPFQNHGSRVQFLFHPSAPGHESESALFVELMIFCPSALIGIYWQALIGGRSSWMLSERAILPLAQGEFCSDVLLSSDWGEEYSQGRSAASQVLIASPACLSFAGCTPFSCCLGTESLQERKFPLTVALLWSLSFAAFFALQEILFISHLPSPLQSLTLHKVPLVSLLSVLHLLRLVGWQTWNWRYHGMCIHFFPLPHLVTFLLSVVSWFLIQGYFSFALQSCVNLSLHKTWILYPHLNGFFAFETAVLQVFEMHFKLNTLKVFLKKYSGLIVGKKYFFQWFFRVGIHLVLASWGQTENGM